MSGTDKRGGYTGGRSAGDVGPPLKVPSSAMAERDATVAALRAAIDAADHWALTYREEAAVLRAENQALHGAYDLARDALATARADAEETIERLAAELASRETYTEEGGYIVARQLARTRRERDEARAALAAARADALAPVLALCDEYERGAVINVTRIRAACADTPTEATT